jgi:surfeit locus 1 family protein
MTPLSTLSRLQGLRFRPRWWAAALVLAACALTVSLGNWQSRRAEEKRRAAERFTQAARGPAAQVPAKPAPAAALVSRRLVATGEFLPQYTILLDNKVYRGRPGYFVVTPLRVRSSAMHVLVNRGWAPAGARREDLPAIATPAGEVTVEGLGLEHAPRVLAAGSAAQTGRVWQRLDLTEFEKWSGLAVQPVFLEQRSELRDGLVRDWPRPDFGIDRHVSYAIQWYLLAGLSATLFIVLSFHREHPPAG